jgi:hypothetical protein
MKPWGVLFMFCFIAAQKSKDGNIISCPSVGPFFLFRMPARHICTYTNMSQLGQPRSVEEAWY